MCLAEKTAAFGDERGHGAQDLTATIGLGIGTQTHEAQESFNSPIEAFDDTLMEWTHLGLRSSRRSILSGLIRCRRRRRHRLMQQKLSKGLNIGHCKLYERAAEGLGEEAETTHSLR